MLELAVLIVRTPSDSKVKSIFGTVREQADVENNSPQQHTLRGRHADYLMISPPTRYVKTEGVVATFAGDTSLASDASKDGASVALRGLIRLCEDKCSEVLDYVHGEFCGAVIDPRRDRMTLIGGRLGVPPLYCYTSPIVTLASDDLELLLDTAHALNLSLTIDKIYVAYFLTGLPDDNFSTTPNPTIYNEIKTLPPGCFGVIDVAPSKIERYWTYWDKPKIHKRGVADRVREALTAAVSTRQSTGETGVLLSGGLDSSSVACVLAENSAAPVYCYSNVFRKSSSMDEQFYAEAVAEKTGAYARYTSADDLWALKDVPDLSRRPQPEPHQGWFYAQEKSIIVPALEDGVRVILDGNGGDELFDIGVFDLPFEREAPSGTNRKAQLRRIDKLQRGLTSAAVLTPPSPNLDALVSPFMTNSLHRETDIRERVLQPFTNLSNLEVDGTTMRRLASFHLIGNTVRDRTWSAREVFSPAGIRSSSPFFDHKLIELVFRVPLSELIAASLSKPLLRKAMYRLLPNPVAKRKLGVELSSLLHQGLVKQEVAKIKALLRDPLVYELGFVEKHLFEEHLRDLLTGTNSKSFTNKFNVTHMWQVIMLEIWLKDQAQRSRLRL